MDPSTTFFTAASSGSALAALSGHVVDCSSQALTGFAGNIPSAGKFRYQYWCGGEPTTGTGVSGYQTPLVPCFNLASLKQLPVSCSSVAVNYPSYLSAFRLFTSGSGLNLQCGYSYKCAQSVPSLLECRTLFTPIVTLTTGLYSLGSEFIQCTPNEVWQIVDGDVHGCYVRYILLLNT